MRDHAVCRADTSGFGFVVTQEDFADFDKCEFLFSQGNQRPFDLIESGNQGAEESAGPDGSADLRDVIIRIRHIEEEGVCVGFIEPLLNVAQFEGHARSEADTLDVFTGEVLHVLTLFVGCDMSI